LADYRNLQKRRATIDLRLDTKEQEILSLVLAGAISDLGDEIGHTENYELRQDLKERKIVLRELLEPLS